MPTLYSLINYSILLNFHVILHNKFTELLAPSIVLCSLWISHQLRSHGKVNGSRHHPKFDFAIEILTLS